MPLSFSAVDPHTDAMPTLAEETTDADRPTVVAEISGRAWIIDEAEYRPDRSDPFRAGFIGG